MYLNKQHKNISFTSEMKQNGSLSFLDIEINRENNKFVNSFTESLLILKDLFPNFINVV